MKWPHTNHVLPFQFLMLTGLPVMLFCIPKHTIVETEDVVNGK